MRHNEVIIFLIEDGIGFFAMAEITRSLLNVIVRQLYVFFDSLNMYNRHVLYVAPREPGRIAAAVE